MKPGSTKLPPALMTRSAVWSPTSPTAAIRPFCSNTSPSITSKASFIVRIVALRTSRDIQLRHPAKRCLRHIGCLAAAYRDELGDNGDGNLLGRDGPDVEADRRVHVFELFECDAFLHEHVVDAFDFCSTADQTQITQAARGKRAQRVEVVSMAAREDHGVRRGGKCGSLQPLRDVVDRDAGHVRKAVAIGELLAIVHDVHLEAGIVRGAGHELTNVAGAENIE